MSYASAATSSPSPKSMYYNNEGKSYPIPLKSTEQQKWQGSVDKIVDALASATHIRTLKDGNTLRITAVEMQDFAVFEKKAADVRINLHLYSVTDSNKSVRLAEFYLSITFAEIDPENPDTVTIISNLCQIDPPVTAPAKLKDGYSMPYWNIKMDELRKPEPAMVFSGNVMALASFFAGIEG